MAISKELFEALSQMEDDSGAIDTLSELNSLVEKYGLATVRAAITDNLRPDLEKEVENVYRKYGLDLIRVETVLPHEL